MNNTENQIRIRKAQNTLVIIGKGILMFGAWTVVKAIGILMLNRGVLLAVMRDSLDPDLQVSDMQILLVLFLVAGLFLALGLALRAFIGLSAISDGMGGHPRLLYIPLSMILVIFSLFGIAKDLPALFMASEGVYSGQEPSVISVIIELTSMILTIEMLSAAIRLKKYRKQEQIREKQHAA